MLTEQGTLILNVEIANEAHPVDGALVRIYGADEENQEIIHTQITDRDGKTQRLYLPTKNRQNSLTPESADAPYSRYDIEIEKNGFYTKRISGVSIFSGVESIQIVAMIPSSDNIDEYYPDGNINATLPESYI